MKKTWLDSFMDGSGYSLIKDFKDWKVREYLLLAALLVVQIVAFTFSPTSYIALFGALCGATCVVLTAKGKVSNYLFGFISSVIIFGSALQAKVFAEMPLQIFYIIVDIVSVIVWFKASSDNSGSVKKARKFSGVSYLIPVALWAVLASSSYFVIYILGDAQPLLDAVTAGMGATAMILLLFRFRENFVFWFLTNLLSIVLWFKAGQYSPVGFVFFALYCCYLVNSIMGISLWNKFSKNENN